MDGLDQQTTVRQHLGVDYFTFLEFLNKHLAPRSYLEIGTSTGWSLERVTCDALCIDPVFNVTGNTPGPRKRTMMFQMGSDEFFADYRVRDYFPAGFDLAFLDGMHRFEFLLRDFINAERSGHSRSLILMHDCLPMNIRMADRRQFVVPEEDPATRDCWTGDVWRILPILQKYRPDLRVRLLDCPPTGLVAISGLNPASDILGRNYHAIVDEFSAVTLEMTGLDAVWNAFPSIGSRSIMTEEALTAVFSVW